jgi:hypothetical protein
MPSDEASLEAHMDRLMEVKPPLASFALTSDDSKNLFTLKFQMSLGAMMLVAFATAMAGARYWRNGASTTDSGVSNGPRLEMTSRLAAANFVGVTTKTDQPGTQLRGGRTAVFGFKEDFDAWRSSLTPEEQEMIQEQARGEYNKAYRKTDAFKKDLPEEKVKAFSKILGKFFENESEDYKKEQSARVPDYDGLLKKAGDKKMDFSLKHCIVELDRNADRRYDFASMKIRKAEQEGRSFVGEGFKYPQSSPLLEKWAIPNHDEESHANALKVIEFMKEAKATAPDDVKPMIDEWVEKGIPPMGEDFELLLPEVLINQMRTLQVFIDEACKTIKEKHTEEETQKYIEEVVPELLKEMVPWIQHNYVTARDEVENSAKGIKEFYRSQAKRKDEGLTKADILKEIWAEIPKFTDDPVPPLDDEMVAELAKIPAVQEGEFMHNWGTADKLYKSEAIDAFGEKYLLGVFETKEESRQAFDNWNKEYEEARKSMQGELAQWSKTEQARLDKDESDEGTQRIRKMLEEAKMA